MNRVGLKTDAPAARGPKERGVQVLPISGVVATLGRPRALLATLTSLAEQSAQPREILIVDASTDAETAEVCTAGVPELVSVLRYVRARHPGAASQRNEGTQLASEPVIWFFDDDIRFEPACVERLWSALESDPALGAVSAMIRNQNSSPPGFVSSIVFALLHGRREQTYAGRCIGPALNLLPDPADHLAEVVPVEWLNTTCTLYRRQALPTPPFPSVFEGYSLMEDVALSLTVGRQWKLANARTARIVHDSQPGAEKSDVLKRARMEVVNRHYVMTTVMGKRAAVDYARLLFLLAFSVATSVHSAREFGQLPRRMMGILSGLAAILRQSTHGSRVQRTEAL